MFRCPACHAALNESQLHDVSQCRRCELPINNVESVPLLVKDRRVIEEAIKNASQHGRDGWFVDQHAGQWVGPYRHHVKKRKRWVEEVLGEWAATVSREQTIGLDMGCGDGANLHWLQLHFSRLYGSDYNVLRLMRAAKLGIGSRIFMADACDYPTDDDSFDVIYFNHVLEHIPDDIAALREVRRILKPGGLVILGVPNEGAAFWQLAYRLQPKMLKTSDHQHFYTADSLAAQCKGAGLTVQKIHPIGWGVPHWTLDALIRRFKWVDDGLEMLGRRFFSGQASSLYAALSK